MEHSRIHFIINPISGQDEPILSYISRAMQDTGIEWDASITKKADDAYAMAKEFATKTGAIAVYGGDGSVMEVAKALKGTQTPLIIIPGGTANVMAKEIGMPTDSQEALKLIATRQLELQKIDMGAVNGTPFLIRVNLGIMADMILQADRKLKENFGQLAYGITTLQTMVQAEPQVYNITIDGNKIQESCVALTVTNSGNIGIEGYSFQPDISIADAHLDLLLLHDTDLLSVLRVAGSALFQTKSDVLDHYKCKEVLIELPSPQKFICDDLEMEASRLHITIDPHSLLVYIPIK